MKGILATSFVLVALATMPVTAGDYAAERRLMLDEIGQMARMSAAETGRETLDPRVLEVLGTVPRHEFVPRGEAAAAYKNRPVPIGYGQTISQPFIVALMTDLLQLRPTDRVLEVGTGSGYQAAVLSLLVQEVYTIEIIEGLGKKAAATLARLGYGNVASKIGDGYQGWSERAPFDAIIVTAAPDHVPPTLVEQLKQNGRMIIPVGEVSQDLMLITKNPDGMTTSTAIVPVRFVPLVRGKTAD